MFKAVLERAVAYRKSLAAFQNTDALRVFYGPGESEHPEFKNIAIDQFGDSYWVTTWKSISKTTLDQVSKSIQAVFPKVVSIAWMDRSEVASDAESVLLYGKSPAGIEGISGQKFEVREFGVPYLIQLEATKHPGLFLDHADLRQWLLKTQQDKTLLNLFSYTGSLSVAAAMGGAKRVMTLDLSKPTIDWAKDNWKNAGLREDAGDFIYGDVFEWLPKFRKRVDQYDTIVCDPPSFSRSKNGVFSTNKDSSKLHELIFPLLKPGGVLVTSINSENYSERNFLKDIENAAMLTQSTIRILRRIDLPETFPTGVDLNERYLKGFYILKV
jgi:23S rRNA (cytosine1962-C5)-methyltransferase